MENETIEQSIFKDLEIPNLSNSSKIFLVGRYAEILLRYDLGISDEKRFSLENGRKAFEIYKNEMKFYKKQYNKLLKLRNKCVHTQKKYIATDEDFVRAYESLYCLYSMIFFKFFMQHSFGSNTDILSCFSLLPPKIRYFTIQELYKLDSSNEWLIDKNVLVHIKIGDVSGAEKIVSDKSIFLKSINMYERFKDIIKNNDNNQLVLGDIDSLKHMTMYDYLMDKIKVIKDNYDPKQNPQTLQEAGTNYRFLRDSFYQKNNSELNIFLKLMDFVYTPFN